MQAIMHTDGIGLEINMLQCMFEAAAGGHELGRWVKARDGYEAKCQKCGLATYASNGALYSFLEGICIGTLTESTQIDFIDGPKEIAKVPSLCLSGYSQVKSFFNHLIHMPVSLFKLTR